MSKFSSERREKLLSKLIGLSEDGLNAEMIAKKMYEDSLLESSGEEMKKDLEIFSDEIQIISQALAFRSGVLDDIQSLYKLLNESYSQEINGHESFRAGDALSKDIIEEHLTDNSFKWILVEAPNGKDIEIDGALLAAVCFSTDGISRRNGEIEGNLGSIRFLGVLPRYQGVCVGLRLLQRTEQEMLKAGCVRSMICIPSSRQSMITWIERRGYTLVNTIPYPVSLGHQLAKDDIVLLMYVKSLISQPKSIPEVSSSSTVSSTNDLTDDDNRGINNSNNSNSVTGNGLTLPPHWRQIKQFSQPHNFTENKEGGKYDRNEIEEDNINLGVD